MNQIRIDGIARAMGRRAIMRGVTGAALASLITQWSMDDLEARKRKNRKRKTRSKVNRFGCRNVGVACSNANQCCSGICEGRSGKTRNGKKHDKTCRAHDTGGCKVAQDSCSTNLNFECTTTTGEDGFCHLTTGNAPYCAFDALDAECTRDEDCVELCGPLAACNVCAVPGEDEFRFCGGPDRCGFPERR